MPDRRIHRVGSRWNELCGAARAENDTEADFPTAETFLRSRAAPDLCARLPHYPTTSHPYHGLLSIHKPLHGSRLSCRTADAGLLRRAIGWLIVDIPYAELCVGQESSVRRQRGLGFVEEDRRDLGWPVDGRFRVCISC
jgi:hypothetical protein